MFNLKSKNFGKKLAAILLAATAVIVPALSFGLTNKSYAETNLPPVGTKVAEKTEAWVIKESPCVKRWHEYTITVYYEGTYDDVFINQVHQSRCPDGYFKYIYETKNQIYDEYSLVKTTSQLIENNWRLNVGGKANTFFGSLNANITAEYKEQYGTTIVEGVKYSTYTATTEYFEVEYGDKNPANHFYGDLLMLLKANKFRVEVHQQQHAKKRKTQASKWSDYNVEEKWDDEYIIYSPYYDTAACYYRKIGLLGTREQYEEIISNKNK